MDEQLEKHAAARRVIVATLVKNLAEQVREIGNAR